MFTWASDRRACYTGSQLDKQNCALVNMIIASLFRLKNVKLYTNICAVRERDLWCFWFQSCASSTHKCSLSSRKTQRISLPRANILSAYTRVLRCCFDFVLIPLNSIAQALCTLPEFPDNVVVIRKWKNIVWTFFSASKEKIVKN